MSPYLVQKERKLIQIPSKLALISGWFVGKGGGGAQCLGHQLWLGSRVIVEVWPIHGSPLAAQLDSQLIAVTGDFAWVPGLMLPQVGEVGKPLRPW